MNIMKLKKRLAIVLSMTMVLSTPVAAFADTSASLSGKGESNGDLNKDVYSVTLPTFEDGDFDYAIDPERLIDETSNGTAGINKDGKTVTPNTAGLYFMNNNGLSTSSVLRAINNSTVDVEIEVKVDKTEGSVVVTDSASALTPTTGNAAMYMGLMFAKSGASATPYALTGSSVVVTASIASCPSAYVTTYRAATATRSGGYVYQIKPGISRTDCATSGWDSAEFFLDGICQEGKIAKDATLPTFEVTWTLKKPANAFADPSISLTRGGLVTMSDLTADRNYTADSVFKIYASDGSSATPSEIDLNQLVSNGLAQLNAAGWTQENGGVFSVQLSNDAVSALAGYKVWATCTLSDGSTLTTPKIKY